MPKVIKYILTSTFKIDFTQEKDKLFTSIHYLKTKVRSYRLLHTVYQLESIKEILELCTRKNSEYNLLKVNSPDDADKLYLNYNWVHIGTVFTLLEAFGFKTIKAKEEKVELDWKLVIFFLKKNWKTLNELGKIYTDVNDLPDTLEGASDKTQANIKMIVLKIINSKLNDVFCMELERNATNPKSKLYNFYSLTFEPEIKYYFKG